MSMSSKKVLISGGAGFIGSNLALALLQQGHSVAILDNLSPQIHGKDPATDSPLYRSVSDKVSVFIGSVTEREDWKAALVDVDTVIHLAAETGTGQSMYQISHYVNVNEGGTAVLLDILTNDNTSVRRVVVASSRAIYGEGKYLTPDGGFVYPGSRDPADMANGQFEVSVPGVSGPLRLVATDEDAAIHPTSVYGITKQNQEQLVLNVCESIGIEAVSLRFQNVYGPGQSLTNPYTGILAIFSNLIQNGLDINVFEDGLESRDFVYIDDVVNATVLAITAPSLSSRIFNVGTGTPTTVLDVVRLLCSYYDKAVPVHITGNFRIGDIRHNFADISRARSILGYEPTVSFEEGLRKFTDWVKCQKVVSTSYESSILEMKSKGLMKGSV